MTTPRISRRARALGSLCLAVLTASACHATVTGDVRVDGRKFIVKECRAGQAFGFSGIELADPDGHRLRLVSNADGTCVAALFPPGGAVGDAVGTCGVLTMKAQSSRINGITNLKGSATLDCASTVHQIGGRLTFESCH